MKNIAALELDENYSEEELFLLNIKRKAERYLALSASKVKIDKEMKEIKKELLENFPKIPKNYTIECPPEVVTIAGQTFTKKMRFINFEKVSVIMRQRIDTKLSRNGLYAIIEDRRKKASTKEEKELLDNIKEDIDKMLNPHSTDIVEPTKNSRGTTLRF